MTQPWVDPALLQLEASHTGTPHEDDATRAAWAELLAGSKPQVGASARNKAASKLARKQAMPQATRGALWLRLSGGEHLLQQRPRMYQEAEAGRRGLRLSDVDIRAPPPQHEAVTLPTFGSPVDPRGLCLTREGLQRAVRVLQCLKYEHSEALYCPFLPTVVVAALHWMDEEQAFAMATGLLHQPCPMVVTRLQTWQRLIAMDRLAMTINPKAYKQLCEYLGVPFAPSIGHNHPLTGAEQLWVSHHLPFWALMRFLDNFIAEGDKTFFRFGLAILQCWYMACPHVVHHGRSKEALSVPPPSLPTDLPVPIRGVSATSSSGAPPGTDSGPSSRSNTASAANTPGASRTSSRKSSMVPATGLSAASGSGDEADLGSSPRRMGGMLAATKAVAVAFMSAFSPSSSSDRRPSNSQTNAGRRNSNSSSNHGAEPDAAPTTAALLKSGGGQRPAPLQLPAHPLPAKGMSKSESPTRRRLSAGVSSSLSPELSPPEPLTPTALDDSGPATVRTTRSVRFTLGSSQDEDVLPPPRDRADSLLSYASDDSNLVMDDTTDGEDTPLARTTASLAKLAMSSNSLTRLERESLRRGNSSDLSSSGEELLHGRRRAHSGGEVKLSGSTMLPLPDDIHALEAEDTPRRPPSMQLMDFNGLCAPAHIAKNVACPDKLVELAFTYSFSRNDVRKAYEACYHQAREAMTATGSNLAVGEPIPARRPRGFSYGNVLNRAQPEIHGNTGILALPIWRALWLNIPARFQLKDVVCIFDTAVDGYRLNSFYEKCGSEAPTVLAIRTMDGDVLGAFLTYGWDYRLEDYGRGYFGSGEIFVFRQLHGGPCETFSWAGSRAGSDATKAAAQGLGLSLSRAAGSEPPALFMHGSTHRLCVGGADGGHAIEVDATLKRGRSLPSSTFGSPSLVSSRSGDFMVASVEVWAFVEHH